MDEQVEWHAPTRSAASRSAETSNTAGLTEGWSRRLRRMCALLRPTALAVALLPTVVEWSQHASAQSIAGVNHFEAIVIGQSATGDPLNIAYEVTDCGLVVGQIVHEGVAEAFVFTIRAQFGLQANELRILPNPVGGGAIALDVNEQGIVVGAVHTNDPLLEQAAVWRLDAFTPPTVQLIDPPPHSDFRSYTAGGFGRLSSVSTEGLDWWAVGHFRQTTNCGQGPLSPPRTRAVAVRVSVANPSLIDYRWEAVSTDEASTARGIARGAQYLGGAQLECDLLDHCALPAGDLARAWTLEPNPNGMLTLDRHADPQPQSGGSGVSTISAILGDGSAVGATGDDWIDFGCRRFACAWSPGTGNSISILPPLVLSDHGKRSHSHDLEASAFGNEGITLGRLAVGYLRVSSQDRGVLWFRPDSAGSDWTSASWHYRMAETMVSCADAAAAGGGQPCSQVTALYGVNRRGDCVGQVIVNNQAWPVLLRAIPQACVGDVTHDGVVNAADLAILLGAWCGSGINCPPPAFTDFNVDGLVDATDLSFMLANWGEVPCDGHCDAGEIDVIEAFRLEAKSALDFSLQLIGFTDLDVYKQWAASVSPELRALVDDFIWENTKSTIQNGGVE